MFHAAKLEIDRVYDGNRRNVPDGWNPTLEYRRAEKQVQMLYRRYQKDNPRARWIKGLLDWGLPIIGAVAGFMLNRIVGTVIGLAIGIVGGQIASRFARKALGLD